MECKQSSPASSFRKWVRLKPILYRLKPCPALRTSFSAFRIKPGTTITLAHWVSVQHTVIGVGAGGGGDRAPNVEIRGPRVSFGPPNIWAGGKNFKGIYSRVSGPGPPQYWSCPPPILAEGRLPPPPNIENAPTPIFKITFDLYNFYFNWTEIVMEFQKSYCGCQWVSWHFESF